MVLWGCETNPDQTYPVLDLVLERVYEEAGGEFREYGVTNIGRKATFCTYVLGGFLSEQGKLWLQPRKLGHLVPGDYQRVTMFIPDFYRGNEERVIVISLSTPPYQGNCNAVFEQLKDPEEEGFWEDLGD